MAHRQSCLQRLLVANVDLITAAEPGDRKELYV